MIENIGVANGVPTLDAAGKVPVAQLPSTAETGDVKFSISSTAASGWVVMADNTIGNAASSATARANADTEDLFILIWNECDDTAAPVSGGRGVSAAADFASNKRITFPRTRGRALGGSGQGATLTNRLTGSRTGTETHVLALSEAPAHTHSFAARYQVTDYSGAPAWTTNANSTNVPNVAINGKMASAGGGGAHQNMQPSMFLAVHIKL